MEDILWILHIKYESLCGLDNNISVCTTVHDTYK